MFTEEHEQELNHYANDQQKVIAEAFNRNYDFVENALTKTYNNNVWHGDLHDNIARIAIMTKDKRLLNLTNHHPRKLLCEYAPHSDSILFLVDCYEESDWNDPNGIASYIWHACSLESAKHIKKFITSWTWGHGPSQYDLDGCNDEVKQHFGWIKPCEKCGNRGDERDICPQCTLCECYCNCETCNSCGSKDLEHYICKKCGECDDTLELCEQSCGHIGHVHKSTNLSLRYIMSDKYVRTNHFKQWLTQTRFAGQEPNSLGPKELKEMIDCFDDQKIVQQADIEPKLDVYLCLNCFHTYATKPDNKCLCVLTFCYAKFMQMTTNHSLENIRIMLLSAKFPMSCDRIFST